MTAVGKAAGDIVQEVRRQFKEIKGLMEGKAEPDYEACITISTNAALRQMVIPGLMAILDRLSVGFCSGQQLSPETPRGCYRQWLYRCRYDGKTGGRMGQHEEIHRTGHLGGKGSPAHKAAVTGDTVGDPFKDTAGPVLNILIKLMAIVAVVFAPLFI